MQMSYDDYGRVVDAVVHSDSKLAQHRMIEPISIGGKGFAKFVSTLPLHMFKSYQIAYLVQTRLPFTIKK
jgi:hypothetical protein